MLVRMDAAGALRSASPLPSPGHSAGALKGVGRRGSTIILVRPVWGLFSIVAWLSSLMHELPAPAATSSAWEGAELGWGPELVTSTEFTCFISHLYQQCSKLRAVSTPYN